MEIDRGRGRPDNNEPRDQRDASPHPENPKQKAPEAGAGLPIPEPEQTQTQLQQGRVEGKQSPQGPTTPDGREPSAYNLDPTIFKNRTLEGMKALYNMIEAGLNEEELLKKPGSYRKGYIVGLLDAKRLLANYIEDAPPSFSIRERSLWRYLHLSKKEAPEAGLNKDSDVKK